MCTKMHSPGIPGIPVAGQVSIAISPDITNESRAPTVRKQWWSMMDKSWEGGEVMEKDEKQTNNGAKEEKNDVFFISNVLTYIGR